MRHTAAAEPTPSRHLRVTPGGPVLPGTSTSYGVPQLGCRCATCTSTDPRNKRTRACVYVETDAGTRLLVDTGPDLRTHALREGVTRIAATPHFSAAERWDSEDLRVRDRVRRVQEAAGR